MTLPPSAAASAYGILDHLLEGCQVLDAAWRYVYVNEAAAAHGRKSRAELVGRTMMEVYPGIERSGTFALLQRCMESRAAEQTENEFTYPDGGTGWFELRIEPVPEGLFILSIDITARKRAEAVGQQQLERLQALRAIDLAILGTTDARLAISTVLDETMRSLRVDAAVVLLVGSVPTLLDVMGSRGFRGRAGAIRVGESSVGRSALERRTIVTTMSAAAPMPVAWMDEGFETICATPLVSKGQVIGVLGVGHRGPLDVTDDWVGFLEALAGQAAMAIDAGMAYEALQRSKMELQLAYETTIEGWSNALDLRDRDTSYHTLRVAEMTVELARRAGMDEHALVHVRRGALLHDIGKMGVPDAILLKPGPLTDDEWAVMRQHPTFAHDLLSPIPHLRPALDIPYCHHEKWDGSGYPRGLKGEAIPLAARLFAVVDIWDALRSDRPYRRGWPDRQVRDHLQSLAGTKLDARAVSLFLELLDAS